MISQTYYLNMVPGGTMLRIPVSQNDTNGSRALVFKLYDGESPSGKAFVVPSGSAVTCDGMKPDGTVFSYAATYSGNTVTLYLKSQMATVIGPVLCQLTVTKNSEVLGSANFVIDVEEDPLRSGSDMSQSQIDSLVAYVRQTATNASNAATSAENAAASAQSLAGAVDSIAALNARFAYTSGASLNNMTTGGLYYCSGDCINGPSVLEGKAMTLEVVANPGGTTVKQVVRQVAGTGWEFERYLVSGTWSDWADSSSNTIMDRFSYISSGSLNSITKTGLYWCSGNCTNRPTNEYASVFSLIVIASPTGSSVKQIARAGVVDGYEYERHLYDGTWTAWKDNSIGTVYNRISTKKDISLNTLTETGLYYCYGTTENAPTKDYAVYAVEVIASDTPVIKQVARAVLGDGFNWERHYYQNAWSSWYDLSTKTLSDKVNALEPKVATLEGRFKYVSSGSMNDLTSSGLYYCTGSVENKPDAYPVTFWVVEVITNPSGGTVKQVARATTSEGYEYERHLTNGSWTDWTNVKPFSKVSGDLSSGKAFPKPGSAQWGSIIILGAIGGIGPVMIGIAITNGAITTTRNLLTNAAWTDTRVTFSYSIDTRVGFLTIKTTSTNSTAAIIIGQ